MDKALTNMASGMQAGMQGMASGISGVSLGLANSVKDLAGMLCSRAGCDLPLTPHAAFPSLQPLRCCCPASAELVGEGHYFEETLNVSPVSTALCVLADG